MGGLGLAALVAALTAGTTALFTDAESTGANTFSNGTIDLTTNPTGAGSAIVSFTNMMPGDSITNPVTVSAAGSQALRYSVSGSATNADTKLLKNKLNLVIKTEGTDCTTFDGSSLYNGDVDGDAGAGGTGDSHRLVGKPAAGIDTGDRALAAGASEVLCFRVSLPSDADNSFKSAATTATFTFDAEQTANNMGVNP
jgi:predicted ribosomally synthesized peptide with SipW-like signal peptide